MTKELKIGLAAMLLPAAFLLSTPTLSAEPDAERFQLERSGMVSQMNTSLLNTGKSALTRGWVVVGSSA